MYTLADSLSKLERTRQSISTDDVDIKSYILAISHDAIEIEVISRLVGRQLPLLVKALLQPRLGSQV